jgi:hypothetical protein
VERCELSDLPKDGCAHCRGLLPPPGQQPGPRSRSARGAAPRAAAPGEPQGLPVQAGYGGWCSGCQSRIRKGEMIQRTAGGGWLGGCCQRAP